MYVHVHECTIIIRALFAGTAMTIIMLLASLNSCTNPWIYLVCTNKTQACCHTHDVTARHAAVSRESRPSISVSNHRTELLRLDTMSSPDAAGDADHVTL